jgi:hypothetical protein
VEPCSRGHGEAAAARSVIVYNQPPRCAVHPMVARWVGDADDLLGV